MRRAGARSGVELLHPHPLTHTYGTRSAEKGFPTLGLDHSQQNVTERCSHVATSERLKRERSYDHLDRLDRTVRRARG